MRIIFMGTPEFAIPSLDILLENGYNVVGVLTATDKRGGRGNKKILESAIKKYAKEKGLNILQPPKFRNPEFLDELRALKADLQIVVAFRMLPEVVWDMPTIGTFNLHGSLLPKYRGAAPINWAVINGETETGATTFFIDKKIDTGQMLFNCTIPIGENETVGEVHDRLKIEGAKLVLKTVQAIEKGEYTPIPQDESLVSKAPKLSHEICEIDFNQSTLKVHNFIRGLSPYPAAWTTLNGETLKIFRTEKIIEEHDIAVGTFVKEGKKILKIATTDGFVKLLEVQLHKRKRMDVKSFLNGYKLEL